MAAPGETEVERLVRHGMQRVPTAQVELLQMRGFLSPGHCTELIALVEAEAATLDHRRSQR